MAWSRRSIIRRLFMSGLTVSRIVSFVVFLFLPALADAQDGFPGHALRFDRTLGERVVCGTAGSTGIDSTMTVEAWIKVPSAIPDPGSAGVIFGNWPAFYFMIITDGRLHYNDGGVTVDIYDDVDLRDDLWHHVAVTRSTLTSEVRLYIDGDLEVTGSSSGTLAVDWPVNIGNNPVPDNNPFEGDIDEVRFWSVERTMQELRENMHLTLTGDEPGLVGYWQLNEGSGFLTADVAGGHDGVLTNMAGDEWILSDAPVGTNPTQEGGVVALWAGSSTAIPHGWFHDASMADRFAFGIDSGEEPGAVGGGFHTHQFSGYQQSGTADSGDYVPTGDGPYQTVTNHTHTIALPAIEGGSSSPLPAHLRLSHIVSNTLEFVPPGLIAMWTQPLEDIPAGWVICDGSGDRPDLSDRFVRGTVAGEEPGTQVENTLNHQHAIQMQYMITDYAVGDWVTFQVTSYSIAPIAHPDHQHYVTVEPHDSDLQDEPPPYRELVFLRFDNASSGLPPLGLIVMWTGSLAEIPDGWSLCDGSEGTPDLCNRFVRGTAPLESPGAIGGGSHSHDADGPYTISTVATQDGVPAEFGAVECEREIHDHGSGTYFQSSTESISYPPFVKVAFIMNQNDPLSGVDDQVGGHLPARPKLDSAYPNPFNPQTTIAFDLPSEMEVDLCVYDMAGRLIASLLEREIAQGGRNEIVWRGRDDRGRHVSSGTYFYRLQAGDYVETKRMTLLK